MIGSLPNSSYKGSPYTKHPCSGPHDDGFFPQETIKRLLKVWKVIHVSWGKVISDEDLSLYSSGNFKALHI